MLSEQASYTFSRDFLSLLRKDDTVADFGRTSVLLRGLQRVYDKVFLYTSHCVVTLHTVGRSGSFRVRVRVKTSLAC